MVVQCFGTFPSAADAPLIPGAQRWMVSSAYRRIPGQMFDAIFDIHPPEVIAYLGLWDEYAAYAREGKRVVLIQTDPRVPTSEAYPREVIQETFGFMGQAQHQLETSFQSSLDWMVALAIYQGATWIDVQGVDMRHQTEYRAQRETFRYWMGIARGRGIRVTVPEPSGLDGACELYGYYTRTGLSGPPGEMRVFNGVPAEMVNA